MRWYETKLLPPVSVLRQTLMVYYNQEKEVLDNEKIPLIIFCIYYSYKDMKLVHAYTYAMAQMRKEELVHL